MVGSNKKHGVNRRHQRGGLLSRQNVADQVIYPYMHDAPFPPYEALSHYNTLEIKSFVASNINKIRQFLVTPKDLTMFSVAALSATTNPKMQQKFIDFGKHLHESCKRRFDAQLNAGSTSPSALLPGWISANNNQYVNIFTNQAQSEKPTREADSELWSVQRLLSLVPPSSVRPSSVRPTSVRPTLTANKTKLTTGETVTITPTYANSATLRVDMTQKNSAPMTFIANTDVNPDAEDVENGLTAEYSDKPFTYEGLPAGTYTLRLIGNDSSESDPLTITVEEPKASGRGGKTRRHKRRPCKRTRKH